MAEGKVTRKELFARIAEVMADDAEVVEMCDKYIAQLSKPRKAKVKPEVEGRRAAVATWLSEQTEPVTRAIAGDALGMTGPQAGAALNWLVAEGQVVAFDNGKAAKTYAWA